MKKWTVVFLLCLLCMGAGKGLYWAKDGFNARRIHGLTNGFTEDLNTEAKLALTQTFHYIGRGRQCFAFASADDRYVLKFLRTDIYKLPFWTRVLPVKSYRKWLEEEQQRREQFIRNSFEISFSELKDQTGLVAIHLGASQAIAERLTVVDKLGCKHHIPLESTSFVLQYKRPLLTKIFTQALQQREREQILDALVDAVVARAQKGILNRDRSFIRNYGFDGQRAYQIDVGSFFRQQGLDPAAAFQKSLLDSMGAVQEWLSQKDPEMAIYLNEKLNNLLHNRN